MPKLPRFAIPVAFVILLVIVIHACPDADEKISYLTETVRRGNIIKTVNATGEVAAVQLLSVGAQVSGQIEKLAVELGQEVKKGDLIAEIDSTTQKNDLEINKAKFSTYEAQLLSREIALKVAEIQYEREKKLKARDAASDESLENAENALAAARANVEETKSLISQTRISVNTAETNLGYTRILAPMDGTVVSVPVEEGQTVNANQTTPTIIQLADLRQMEIKMQISEGDVTKVKPGLGVTYTILSEPDRVFEGLLHSVDPGLTTLSDGGYSGSIDAGTAIYYYGKVLAPNDDGALRIGMTTQNTITIGEAIGVLTVPSIAVNRYQNRSFVRVLEKGRPVEREIQTGLSDNMNTEVRSGLSEGEQVVAAQMSSSELAEASSSTRLRGGPPRF
ncbi:MAG: efflux RND transporter periplasmic adaptor subunit [Candidatus Adiutrix sp.]|jgi:macrolide-specific efflux system membrane fusion protein|nr:efflux RND transporter periplasmic adaptor subunit [Candidatus Adiutrix sp.]